MTVQECADVGGFASVGNVVLLPAGPADGAIAG
jgi:hypothetical protein